MHRPILALLAPALALAAATGCEQTNVYQEPPPPRVTVENPVAEPVTRYAVFPATLAAPEEVDIRARVRGFLESVEFRDGDIVEEGQLLYRIEPELFEANRDSAAAEVARAEAVLELAKVKLQRVEEAVAGGAVSDIEVIEARAERDKSEAELKAARAALASAELDLSYTEIRAPIAGRLSRTLVTQGNLVGQNEATLLTTLVADLQIFVYFDVDERRLLQLVQERPRPERQDGPPKEVSLTLADGSAHPRTGVADYATNVIDRTTGTLQVRATFDNADSSLFPGMFARVRVPLREFDGVTIPTASILRDQVGPYVLLVDAEGTVARRDVTPEFVTGDRTVISDGLAAEDRVITIGVQRARPGGRVVAEGAGAPAGAAAPDSPETPAADG